MKKWFITGVSSGLGRALAIAAIGAGDVVGGSVRQAAARESFRALHQDRAQAFIMDVTHHDAVTRVMQAADEALGGIDVLVNNAGYGQFTPFEQMSTEDFQAVVDTCFYGVVYTTRAALPVMRRQKSGHIFQVSSVGGRMAIAGNTSYHAAKWAVGGFSDSLAMEVAPFGVKVCTLEPGGIRTNWARRAGQSTPELLPEYESSVGPIFNLLQRIQGHEEGDPRRIAELIVQWAGMDDVPLRLVLGVDAEQRVQAAEAARASEAAKWHHLTVSTVFEDAKSIHELLHH